MINTIIFKKRHKMVHDKAKIEQAQLLPCRSDVGLL